MQWRIYVGIEINVGVYKGPLRSGNRFIQLTGNDEMLVSALFSLFYELGLILAINVAADVLHVAMTLGHW